MARKVLVVDDDCVLLTAVRGTLRRAGFEVEVACDVFGLPLVVGRFQPDLVLLDVGLPASDGAQLAASLLRLRSARSCKIVFHSGKDEAELRELVRKTGTSGFIPKGLAPADLVSTVKQFLGETA